jgi:nucleoside-diphosphate-sugar epimerase
MRLENSIIKSDDSILITGSNGFIGSKVVASLLDYGLCNLQCLVRTSSDLNVLNDIIAHYPQSNVEVIKGNLLSQEDCNEITKNAKVIYHLAAGRGDKSFPNAFLNSVVTTKNLLTAAGMRGHIKRFVNVSSFTVYSNYKSKRGELLDESSRLEDNPIDRGEAYCYAKVKQEQIVREYCNKYQIPYVILRPGVVYGPGNKGIHGRVGIGTFGFFMHLGGQNTIPLSYVDNCADAIVLAGLRRGVDGEVFNVVDDELPTSKEFLRQYKNNVRNFKSVNVSYKLFYFLCYLWERYSSWSQGQLPSVFNRRQCSTYWKGNRYSNDKMKKLLGWQPRVPFKTAMERYFDFQRKVRIGND